MVTLSYADGLVIKYDFALVNMKFKALNWSRVICIRRDMVVTGIYGALSLG